MLKDIKKTIRFSFEEYEKIDYQLKENNLSFTDFARKAILKERINYPIKIEQLYFLNLINENLENIAKKSKDLEKKVILIQLIQIEKAIKELV